MRKTLFSLFMVTVFGMPGIQAAGVLFNFDSTSYTAGKTQITLNKDSYTLSLSTTYTGGFGSDIAPDSENAPAGENYTLTGEQLAVLNSNVGLTDGSGFTADICRSYVSAGSKTSGSNLTITLSNLTAGASYNISLVTGVAFEGAGSWNKLTTTNSYKSSSITLGTESIAVKALTPVTIQSIVADQNGEISLKIVNSSGAHTAAINALAITEVPEPATATLSLLALVGLAARRRRRMA
ncbi:MAG: PEP-CTERM sorting domain-containing protein [Akkermansia muciniphila]|nr:PEP-CTERM sorting domain-containing protein [Akkermansia muciniphila]